MPREINQAGYRLIKEFEAGPLGNSQPALTPYLCPAGVWTNGWGNTHNVTPTTPAITRAQAEADLERNLDWAEECVDKACPGANDNEFSAMVSLTFNIGAPSFQSSTAARLFNKGDKAGAAAAMGWWKKFKDPNSGQLLDSPGLIRRRGVEQALFLTPAEAVVAVPAVMAPLPIPAGELMPQAVVGEKPAAKSTTVITGGVAIAGTAASVAGQLNDLTAVATSAHQAVSAISPLMKYGPVVLSVLGLGLLVFIVVRYVIKRRRGEVLST